MNWKAWIWGGLSALFLGSYNSFISLTEIPNPTDVQIIRIVASSLGATFIAWFIKSPFPGSVGVIPLSVITRLEEKEVVKNV